MKGQGHFERVRVGRRGWPWGLKQVRGESGDEPTPRRKWVQGLIKKSALYRTAWSKIPEDRTARSETGNRAEGVFVVGS